MSVGLKIKMYLAENGITQTYLSKKTGINSVKLNLSLNGKRTLGYDEYELICGVLGVNTDKFLTPKLFDDKPKAS